MVRGIVMFAALAMAHLASAATLEEIFANGWSRLPETQRLPALIDADRARAEQAQASFPEPGKLTLSHRSDRWGEGRGKEEWEAELSWPLWRSAQRPLRQAEAAAEAALTRARAMAAQLAFAGELRKAWWEVAKARLAVELAEARAETAEALMAEVERRFGVGLSSRLERNLAKEERLAAHAEAAAARQLLAQAETAFADLAGETAPLDLQPEAGPEVAPSATLDEHPLVQEKAAELRLAEARLRLAPSSDRAAPEIAVALTHGREGYASSFNQIVGFKLSWPFASAARRDEALARARAEQLGNETTLARLRATLARGIARAQAALAQAEDLARQAQERRRLAQENRELARRAYALGEFDLATRLRYEGAARLAEAEQRKLQLAVGEARSQLKQAMGILP